MKSPSNRPLFVAAGGTGGHIFPALALAHTLQQQGQTIHWIGSEGPLEKQCVAPHFPLKTIAMRGARGKDIKSLLQLPWRLLTALWQCVRYCLQYKPKALLAMGGYVTVPAGLAAKLCGIPLIIHEQNTVAGFSNRLLARLTSHQLQGFEGALKNATTIGNPLRLALIQLAQQERKFNPSRPLRLLVLGGSQGAQAINQLITAYASTALGAQHLIWHQTGRQNLAQCMRIYQEHYDLQDPSCPVRVDAFIDNMETAYAWADCVVARSGALTISELAALGLPSVLIPLPHAVDNHQLLNAQPLAQTGGAVIVEQKNATPQKLADIIQPWINDRTLLQTMHTKAKAYGTIKATAKLSRFFLSCCKG